MDHSLVVVDIGNSSVKIALFASEQAEEIPRPIRVTRLAAESTDFTELENWLPKADFKWLIGSVQTKALQQLTSWLKFHVKDSIRIITHSDLSLPVETREPAAVGIDRLAAAMAANSLREPDKNRHCRRRWLSNHG